MTQTGFQTQVQVAQAPAVLGDFASANPRYSVDAGPNGIVAGANGLLVGNFAWLSYSQVDGDGAPAVANNLGNGLQPDGLLHREQQGLITIYLQQASLLLPAGFQATLMSAGDFWVLNSGATQATPGMKAFANWKDGSIFFAAAGSSPGSATSSSFTIAAETFSITAGINGNLMTVSAVGSGTIVNGAIISGTGVTTGNQVVDQVSGTTGGVGVYQVKWAEQNVANGTTISGTYGLLTAGGTISGTFGIGQLLSSSGSDVSAGTVITALGTGTGGAGTYIVQNTQTSSSGTLSATLAIETNWTCRSSGLAGEIVKITRLP